MRIFSNLETAVSNLEKAEKQITDLLNKNAKILYPERSGFQSLDRKFKGKPGYIWTNNFESLSDLLFGGTVESTEEHLKLGEEVNKIAKKNNVKVEWGFNGILQIYG